MFKHILEHSQKIEETIINDPLGEIHIIKRRCSVNTTISSARNNSRNRNLTTTLTSQDWREIRYNLFNDRCALTNKRSTTVDLNLGHFIALDTGHGGTCKGNVFPIESTLNTSMRNYNPFYLYEHWYTKFGLVDKLFIELVEYLASLNNLSTNEYESYVNWCYDNPRGYTRSKFSQNRELAHKPIDSIELWKRVVR